MHITVHPDTNVQAKIQHPSGISETQNLKNLDIKALSRISAFAHVDTVHPDAQQTSKNPTSYQNFRNPKSEESQLTSILLFI